MIECPLGTFGGATSLKAVEDCDSCSPGKYCNGTGLEAPSGVCAAGFYCRNGSFEREPSEDGNLRLKLLIKIKTSLLKI